MISLQLYIEGSQVELHETESVTLTQSLQDVLDLQKIFTDYSRTFNVPASKTNNKIFKHYYNPNIQGFDARSKKDAELYLNYKPFKSGKIKLQSVQMKDNSPLNYRVTFFGKTVEMTDILGADKLSNLSNIKTALLYEANTIKTRMVSGYSESIDSTTVNDAIIYPIITHTKRLIYDSSDDTIGTYNVSANGVNNHGLPVNELKPAVRVHLLIKAIEDKYGFKFSTDFFNENNPAYYNLYLWLNKQKGKLEQEDGNRPALKYSSTVSQSGDLELGRGFQELGYINKGSYSGRRFLLISVQATAGVEYTLKITSNGTYEDPFYESTHTATGGNDVIISTADALELVRPTASQGTTAGNPHHISIITNQVATFTVNKTVVASLNVGGTRATNVGTYTSSLSYQTTVINEMPDITVIDFLTGLFKAFNLTAYYNNNIINITPLDDFYASSETTYNITEHIDRTTSEVTSVLPYNRIAFEYEGNETFLSAYHKQIFGSTWGAVSEVVENVPEGQDYVVKLPFEHQKFEKLVDVQGVDTPDVQWGWSVNQDQESYLGKPLLFYAHKVENGTPINVLDAPGGAKDEISTYYIPSNLANPTDSTSQSIHFGQEKNEYTAQNANNSLFNTYYKKYITESVNTSRRLFKFKAYLPLRIILNIELQDKVIIFNDLYKINKIVTNFETGVSQLELLNEVLDYDIPIENAIADTVKTVNDTLFTADTTKITADAGVLTI